MSLRSCKVFFKFLHISFVLIVLIIVEFVRCEYLWQKKVDLYGIHHPETNYYADLHDRLLESRKNGYYLSSSSSSSSFPISASTSTPTSISNITFLCLTKRDFEQLNDDAYFPHYLSKSFHQTYHSTSILGRLYDIICQSIDQIQLNIPPPNEIDDSSDGISGNNLIMIDSSFQIDYNICCCCFSNLIDRDLIQQQQQQQQERYSQESQTQFSSQLSQSTLQRDELKSLYLQTAKEFFHK